MKRVIHIKSVDPLVAQKLAQELSLYFDERDKAEAKAREKKKPGFFKRLFSKKDK